MSTPVDTEKHTVHVVFNTAEKAKQFAEWLVKHGSYEYRYYSYAVNAGNGVRTFVHNNIEQEVTVTGVGVL